MGEAGGRDRHKRLGDSMEMGVILFIIYAPAGNWLFGAALFWILEETRKAWRRAIK